jgi:BirA family transcriptional regulator, biotin operon repressor / biotin---[acetyl-CoA-carboxylase] ligase
VDSTNNYAMAKLRTGMAEHGQAFVAKEQTAGKGQRGKTWQMAAEQSIALSLIVKADKLKQEQQFLLSMAVSLGVYDFFEKYAGDKVKIKWPNDLYWRDRKAGGILIETVFKGMQWKWAVVGIGININQTRFSKLLPNPISLRQITGNEYDVIEMATELYSFVMKRIEKISAQSTKKMLKEYNLHLYKLHEPVKLKKANAVFTTTVKEVSVHGQLCTIDTTERQFDFGEVEWLL